MTHHKDYAITFDIALFSGRDFNSNIRSKRKGGRHISNRGGVIVEKTIYLRYLAFEMWNEYRKVSSTIYVPKVLRS